jgi:hypothetical protein
MAHLIAINQPIEELRKVEFNLTWAIPKNAKHLLNLNDILSPDTFTLTYPAFSTFASTETTGAITGPATAGTDISAGITSAINALTRIDTVTVVKGTGQTYEIEYTGTSAAYAIPLPTVNPTGFSPLATTRVQMGGPIGAPAMGVVLASTDAEFSKRGGTRGYFSGTFAEIGNGAYIYTFAPTEVDTEGGALVMVLRSDLEVAYIKAQIWQPPLGAPVIYEGTAVSGTANSIVLASDAPPENGKLNGALAYIYDGTGSLQSYRQVTAWNGDPSSKEAVIYPPWAIIPNSTSKVRFFAGAPGIDTTQIATLAEMRDEIVPNITNKPLDVDDLGRVAMRGTRGSV